MARTTPFQLAAGLDFGTAFTKVMLRNTVTDELYAVPFAIGGKEEFFLPSVLMIHDGQLIHPIGRSHPPISTTVPYLEMALAEKCRGTTDHWTRLVTQTNGNQLPFNLEEYVEALVACYLVDVVRCLREFALRKWPDLGTHPEDKILYQMSLPAEDAQEEEVLQRFKKCLFWAVEKAESGEQESSLPDIQTAVASHPGRDDCFFLAEVTANVLTYRLSRAGRPGLYLFVDVGAGTVDLSVFLYPEPEFFGDQMNYAAARVSLTGSSQIELRAMASGSSQQVLAELRACKEDSSAFPFHNERIHAAKSSLVEELGSGIRETLGEAQSRFVPTQFKKLEVLVGGGGWCEVPYLRAVQDALRAFSLHPEPYPLPRPENSTRIWGKEASRLAPRFSVAHGLSHPFWDWPPERYPHQMSQMPRPTRGQRAINPIHESDG